MKKRQIFILSYVVLIVTLYFSISRDEELTNYILSIIPKSATQSNGLIVVSFMYSALVVFVMGSLFHLVIKYLGRTKINFFDSLLIITASYALRSILMTLFLIFIPGGYLNARICALLMAIVIYYMTPHFIIEVEKKARLQQILTGIGVIIVLFL